MWKNIAQPDRPNMAVWRMRIACWMPKATNTPSEYVLLIAFSLQLWLNERASMFRYAYTAFLVAPMYAYVGPIVSSLQTVYPKFVCNSKNSNAWHTYRLFNPVNVSALKIL